MKYYDEQLDAVLERIEHNIDIANVASVDDKYRNCLAFEPIERPPLVCQPIFGKRWRLPAPWNEFIFYSYRESFEHPPAMMHNMLLNRVVPRFVCSWKIIIPWTGKAACCRNPRKPCILP